jgi:hypothetical protein
MPQTQAAALATAQKTVVDADNELKDQLGSANVFLQKQSGPTFYKELERYPEANKLFKDDVGNWLPEDKIKSGLNDFTASRTQDIDTQRYKAKYTGKSTAAITNAREFYNLTQLAAQGDTAAAQMASSMARQLGYGDAKALQQKIIADFQEGNEVSAEELTMLMVLGMKDPISISLFSQLSRDPKYVGSYQEALNAATGYNRTQAGVGAVQQNIPEIKPYKDGKKYPHVKQDQIEQFMNTAPNGTLFVYEAPNGTTHLKKIQR